RIPWNQDTAGGSRRPSKTRTPGPLAGPGRREARGAELGDGDVRGAGPLGAVHHLELDLVALVQGAETLGADLGVVDEHVRTTLTRQETKTLGLVEPLDGA